MPFLFIITAISSSMGAIVLLLVFVGAKSAPQEAAGAAAAVALAVIPYIFSRCIQISTQASLDKQRHAKFVDLLEQQIQATKQLDETSRTL